MFPNNSYSTVYIHSVLILLGIIKRLNWCIIVKIDIKGAYVQTQMTGDPVYMRINRKISKQIIELFPEYGKIVDKD
jgi:hypothetical protein